MASVARDLGVSEGLIHDWKKKFRQLDEESDQETARLKRENRELRMENGKSNILSVNFSGLL